LFFCVFAIIPMPTPPSSATVVSQKAWAVLESCVNPHGIQASPQNRDNYRRIWSRDAMMAGLTGVLHGHPVLATALTDSVETLALNQAENGQIPSNVLPGSPADVSFGSLAGRVDATSWWLIGSAVSLLNQPDEARKARLAPRMDQAFRLLHSWEMNQKGLMYTPPGGNWADEYLTQGYTLYDNALRIWALRLAAKALQKPEYQTQADALANLLAENFYARSRSSKPYHPHAFEKAQKGDEPYFWSSLGPQGYDTRWDMPGNALVLLLNLHPEPARLETYIRDLSQVNGYMLPVFYPIVHPEDPEWYWLEKNFSFQFKNKPHHFHNGGCWPIFLGWLGLGLAANGQTSTAVHLKAALQKALENENPPYAFHEYWSTDQNQPGGVHPLAFTASGWLLLEGATSEELLLKTAKLFPG
jgi:hypothetical protein